MTATLDAPTEVPLEPAAPTAPPRARRPRPLLIAGAASLSAGFIHAAAIGAHADHPEAARAFVGVAMLQFVWGAYVLVRPSRQLAWIGVALNTGLVAGWALAKTKGLWFISGLDVKEPVQWADGLAAALAFVSLVAALVVALRGRRARGDARPLLTYAVVIALVALALPGMVQAGNHVHSHGSTVVVGANGKAQVVAEGPTQVRAYDPTKPIDLSGTPGVTPEQQARAEMLVAATLYKLPQFADAKYAESLGFHTIGDAVTGDEHLVNWNYIDDGKILDPDYPEALVYNTRGGGRVLESAMYMLPPGSTLDTVPDIGGALTQWHIHNNLCLTNDPVAPRVAGLTDASGQCHAPLIKPEPVPMIHVWITPNPCGPFAALTGVGAGQVKAGELRLCDSAHGTGL